MTLDRARAPAAGALRPFRFPPVKRDALGNGVPVLCARSNDLPLVTIQVVLDAGGLLDPPGHAGTASLTASLLESGTARRTAEQIAIEVDDLGISLDVGSSWDGVTVGFTGLLSRMERGFALIAELLREPTFPEDEVARLRAERLGTLKHRRADPGALAGEVMHRFAFADGSAFARPLSGTRQSIEGLDREVIAGFHAVRYGPRVATVVAAGAAGLDEVVRLGERYLGDWAATARPGSISPSQRGESTTTIVVANRPGAVQSEIRIGHVGVERTAPDYAPLQVMNAILGGTFSSRLNLNLRERLGYTYGASSSWASRRVPGVFSMGAAVQTEATAHSVAEMLREMRGMRAAPPAASEVSDARSYLAGVMPLTVETTAGVAARLAALATYGLPDGYWDEYRTQLLGVTPEQAHAAAVARLEPERAVVAVCADATEVSEALNALGEGEVRIVDPEELLR